MPSTARSLDALIELIQPNEHVLADGARRMEDIWHGRSTDSLPLLFSAPVREDVSSEGLNPNEQMLYEWTISLVGAARSGSDIQLTIRANTGTGTLATIAGCQLTPCENNLPWTEHITRETIEAFDADADYAHAGIMPQVHDLYAYFKTKLPSCVHFFCADTQGPFDLAHLFYGEEIFYALYDEPEFVHQVLEKATKLYIRGTKLLKTWIDEPLDGGYHWGYRLANGGVRACEDTSTLLSPDSIAEFVLPYQERALAAFGGGFIHYCGDNAALYDGELRSPMVRG
ncbi:MAG TPA: hypothetical protein VHV83_00025, partial [Armatimonadota bacterium]|nr:hypothetical protein [Armatimonadota bacterium]